MVKKKRRRPRKKAARLADLIGKHPALLEVLDRHGVNFCAGCYLTLTSPLDRVVAYHAVPDLKKFLADVKKAVL